MAAMKLQELKDIFSHLVGKKAEAMQELEVSLRAKGNVTRVEDVTLRACMSVANAGFTVVSTATTLLVWFGIGQGSGFLPAKVMYYATLHVCAIYVLDHGEERMKMELANIILTKHSDEKSLVEGVKRHFFAEHLFSDQYQDKPLFRWHQRHSYVDSNFVVRVKEIEANNSEDEAITVSGQTAANIRSFGDLMDDPLACILGSPDSNTESNKPPEQTDTILNRRDLRACRRSHRHHHRHADKFVAL